ncbi:MAG: glycosyltransferase family 2 protein [Deltaproteobacteria bacterium]|uniref:glycosyltransferase family 2 protein n=1 Tax=Desulfobacula sp. TaxID=2593537 RepID=UPI0019AB4982|nr:glycosyltransferase family 2 protein [Candidatus Desulfobacula maris]MBL6993971.1 glycosyltransferase family 2 protein [Desulfobacula sp.]
MISFIIPVYNEEGSLKELHDNIFKVMKEVGKPCEILFINDGSTDQSPEVIREIIATDDRVKTVNLRKNFGKSVALNIGFKRANGDLIFTMDSDLQDDPIEIPNFLKAIEEGADLVTGWKVNRQDPKEKTIPSKVFNTIVSIMSGLKLKDYNCGFKCYKKRVTQEVRLYGELHRFVPFLAHKKGFKIKEIPVKHRERKFGVSKFGPERYARGFFDLLTVIFITNYLKRPMHLFGWVGSFFFFTGLLIFSYLFFGRWIFGESVGTSPLFSISILMLGNGIQIFIIGLVAELIVHNKEREDLDSYSVLDDLE